MKSSNPKVMIECYRLLVARLERGRRRTGIIRSTSASPKPAKARTAASRAPSASARCCATASATPFAFRSRKTASAKFPVAQALVADSGAPDARIAEFRIAALSFDPFSFRTPRTPETIERDGVTLRRRRNCPRRRHARDLGQGRAQDRPQGRRQTGERLRDTGIVEIDPREDSAMSTESQTRNSSP